MRLLARHGEWAGARTHWDPVPRNGGIASVLPIIRTLERNMVKLIVHGI